VILRDEKNASQGDKTERNKERRKAKEREAGTRNKTTFLVQIFLNDFFPSF